jgi:hypothetical protein
LWTLFQAATAASDEQIVIGIQEVSPSQAMEMGKVMPEVAGEGKAGAYGIGAPARPAALFLAIRLPLPAWPGWPMRIGRLSSHRRRRA